MWHRIFCRSERITPIEDLSAHLHAIGLACQTQARGDDLGWTGAELRFDKGSPIYLERYLTSEDELRDDLNTWAAFLETCDYSQNRAALMEHVIQTRQLITLRKPIDHADEILVEQLCLATCQFIAARSDGVYQIDDDGWYNADGTLMVKEY